MESGKSLGSEPTCSPTPTLKDMLLSLSLPFQSFSTSSHPPHSSHLLYNFEAIPFKQNGKGEMFFHLAEHYFFQNAEPKFPKPCQTSLLQTRPKVKEISEGCREMNVRADSDHSRFEPQLYRLLCDLGPYFLIHRVG